MKVTGIDILVAGAGWRNFNFLKVSTDEGLTGWADFSEGNVGGAIAPLIRHIRLLSGPGWGAEVDEEAVREHPPIEEKAGLR